MICDNIKNLLYYLEFGRIFSLHIIIYCNSKLTNVSFKYIEYYNIKT